MTNLIEVLGVASKEDVISNLLAAALKDAPAFRDLFFRVSGIELPPDAEFSVETRVAVPGVGVPDIVAWWKSNSRPGLLVIENKLNAKEGYLQTDRYASDECVAFLREKGSIQPHADPHFVLLELFPDSTEGNGPFQVVRYESLLAYRGAGSGDDPEIARLLDDFLGLVRRFHDAANLVPERSARSCLSTTAPLDGGYLAFRTFMADLCENSDFRIDVRFRDAAPGRSYFGALISKSGWHDAGFDTERPGDFDPYRHINIHFEPQYDALGGRLTLYLHYETNPYMTRAWIKKNVPAPLLEEYDALRSRFSAGLREAALPGVIVGGRSNQVAKVNENFADMTITEATKSMRSHMERIGGAVDRLLEKARRTHV